MSAPPAPVVALIGPARAGKDTLALALGARFGYRRFAFADALKRAALATNPTVVLTPDDVTRLGPDRAPRGTLRYWEPRPVALADLVAAVGWDDAKACPAVRTLLQRLGVAMRENVGPDVWVRAALAEYQAATIDAYPEAPRAVFTDVRFSNEVEALRGIGALVVRIVRPDGPALTASAAAHVSETELAAYVADYTVTNDGTVADLNRAAADVHSRALVRAALPILY